MIVVGRADIVIAPYEERMISLGLTKKTGGGRRPVGKNKDLGEKKHASMGHRWGGVRDRQVKGHDDHQKC